MVFQELLVAEFIQAGEVLRGADAKFFEVVHGHLILELRQGGRVLACAGGQKFLVELKSYFLIRQKLWIFSLSG